MESAVCPPPARMGLDLHPAAVKTRIMNAALNDLIVPEKARKAVASDSKNHVDIGDFEKDRVNLDRKWAELCYVRLWLTRNLEEGSHNTFFNEPRFFRQKLELDFDAMRDRITRIKQIRPGRPYRPRGF